MKSLLATLSLVAVLAACATPYAQREFDFSDLNGLAGLELGTVESVEVVRIERDIHADTARRDPDPPRLHRGTAA